MPGRAVSTVLLLERGEIGRSASPRGVRWTGVWVDDPDSCYSRVSEINIDARPPLDEPWGVRLVRVVDQESRTWALMKRASNG
jgi:hypothetical protein